MENEKLTDPRNNGRGKAWRTGISSIAVHHVIKQGETYFLHGNGCDKGGDNCLECQLERCKYDKSH